ncbi:MAG: hypothetical protein AMXMBFR12_03720 [Candidatus Babeliales bacterium]
MKLKRMFALLFIHATIAVAVPDKPAPVVNVIFGNKSNNLEAVFSLAEIGSYQSIKNAGLYYPQILPAQSGQIKKDSVVFDPAAYSRGIGSYPFMFSYKGGFYYLFFSNSELLKEKSNFPFFATVIKVVGVDERTKSAKIETITNIDFNQNDVLVIALDQDEMKFYNMTTQVRVRPLSQEHKQSPAIKSPPPPVPPRGVSTTPSRPMPRPPVPPRRPTPPARS